MRNQISKLLFFLCMLTVIAGCSRRQPANINAEQAHNPLSAHIIAPGMGTIGLISNEILEIYFPEDIRRWAPDETSRFAIPQPNHGILAVGMGTLGVIEKDVLRFYRLDTSNQWARLAWGDFNIPGKYDRVIAMKMPWEMGVLGLEHEGMVDFYFYYDGNWQMDPSATFMIPNGIDSYYPLGDMTMAVIQGNKLGIYYLGPEEGWEFLDHDSFVLLLPDDHQAIIPYEPGKIAVLVNHDLQFFQLDLLEDRWIKLADLEFNLPR